MPKRIYVGNLPSGATQREGRNLFSRHGSVSSVQLEIDHATGRLTALVEMSSGVDEAITTLNKTVMGGQSLNVKAG